MAFKFVTLSSSKVFLIFDDEALDVPALRLSGSGFIDFSVDKAQDILRIVHSRVTDRFPHELMHPGALASVIDAYPCYRHLPRHYDPLFESLKPLVLRDKARQRTAERMRLAMPVRVWRLEGCVYTARTIRDQYRHWKSLGKTLAETICKQDWVQLRRQSRKVFADVVPADIQEAINRVLEKFDMKTYVFPKAIATLLADHNVEVPPEHYLHVSEVDPTQVAYCPSYEYLKADRWIRTKPGRYLTKFFSDKIPEKDIRNIAQVYDSAYGDTKLHFVENTDPDGWVWVYEHGYNFTSCMVYDRSDRYLDEQLCDDYHPVRAYAHPKNKLRLAYIGDPVGTPKGKVYGRAIVVEDGEKRYVRVYGDDRMRPMLESAGYEPYGSMEGQLLQAIAHPCEDTFILPYLDSGEGVYERSDGLVICDSEDAEFGFSSTGVAERLESRHTCECCGEGFREDPLWAGIHGDDPICGDCSGDYHYVTGRRGQMYYVPEDQVTVVDGTEYDSDYLEDNNICECEECGELHHEDEMESIDGLLVCLDCCVSLDRPSPNGDDYAVSSDTEDTADGLTIHKDHAVTSEESGNTYHVDDMLHVVGATGSEGYIHPDELESYVNDLYVFACNKVLVLSFDDMSDVPGWTTLQAYMDVNEVDTPEYLCFSNVERGSNVHGPWLKLRKKEPAEAKTVTSPSIPPSFITNTFLTMTHHADAIIYASIYHAAA